MKHVMSFALSARLRRRLASRKLSERLRFGACKKVKGLELGLALYAYVTLFTQAHHGVLGSTWL